MVSICDNNRITTLLILLNDYDDYKLQQAAAADVNSAAPYWQKYYQSRCMCVYIYKKCMLNVVFS